MFLQRGNNVLFTSMFISALSIPRYLYIYTKRHTYINKIFTKMYDD